MKDILALPERTLSDATLPFALLFWLPALAMLLAADSRLSAQEWVDFRRAQQFVCRADFHLAGYEPLLIELQQLQDELGQRLQLRPSAELIELFLFRNKSSYMSYVGRQHPGVPFRRALFVKGKGPGQVYAFLNDDFQVDVRHESTHALLHASLPMVPLWLDEGLAEYFEVAAPARADENPHLSTLKWNIRLGLIPRLATLEQKHELSQMGKKEYVYAWAWVHFMLHGPPEGREELLRYIDELRAEMPAEPLSIRLERRLPGLEKRFAAHFKSWSG